MGDYRGPIWDPLEILKDFGGTSVRICRSPIWDPLEILKDFGVSMGDMEDSFYGGV
jgi:hypothetical protein